MIKNQSYYSNITLFLIIRIMKRASQRIKLGMLKIMPPMTISVSVVVMVIVAWNIKITST